MKNSIVIIALGLLGLSACNENDNFDNQEPETREISDSLSQLIVDDALHLTLKAIEKDTGRYDVVDFPDEII